LNTWGDGRLTILGTDGYIELRKNVDIAGHEGGNHLFLVDKKETRYFDCSKDPLPFGEQFISDVANRTNTAMTQRALFPGDRAGPEGTRESTEAGVEEVVLRSASPAHPTKCDSKSISAGPSGRQHAPL